VRLGLGRGRRVAEKEAVGHEGVDVGMEVEVFAKGVQGEDDAGDAFWAVQGGAQVFGQALVSQGAEPLEEMAVALEIGPQHLWDGQDVMTMRNGCQHAVQHEPGGRLYILLMAGGAEPATVSLDLESLTDRFTVLGEDYARVDPGVWQRAGRAINQSERLRLRYQRFDGATRDYLLEPYHLVAYHGNWYLLALNPAAGRIESFALSRCRTLAGTGSS
jgi:hypothetical protein